MACRASRFQPGQRVLVCYDLRAAHNILHERLLLSHVTDEKWIICTPDYAYYEEDLDEVEELLELGARGGVPRGLGGRRLYRFGEGEINRQTLPALLEEGRKLQEEELARQAALVPVPAAAPAPAVPPGQAAAQGAHPVPPVARAPPPPGLPPPPPGASLPPLPLAATAPPLAHVAGGGAPAAGGGGGVTPRPVAWRALEARGGLDRGDSVDASQVQAVGDRGVIVIAGISVAVGYMEFSEDPGPDSDVRTLSVKFNTHGSRERDFKDAAALQTENSFEDWPVRGPRTARWLVAELARQQMTPTQRHFWWRQLMRLGPSDYGVSEHESISRALENFLCYDQLNLGDLAGAECLARRYQLLEESYSRRLLESEGGGVDDGHQHEHALFLGSERSRGRALVSPQLEEWIAERLREEAAVMKERRKGREERQLSRQLPAGPPAASDKPPPGGRGHAGGGKK